MAWHIIFFLKSLRSLEEFRKNPHVKIPPKSASTNFQRLGKFKNPIFIRKEFFLGIQPTQPSLARAGPLCTAGHARVCLAHPGLRGLGVFAKSRLFFEFAQPATTPSSSFTATRAPPVTFVISPTSADPKHASPAPRRN
jgi:hypothetical protein